MRIYLGKSIPSSSPTKLRLFENIILKNKRFLPLIFHYFMTFRQIVLTVLRPCKRRNQRFLPVSAMYCPLARITTSTGCFRRFPLPFVSLVFAMMNLSILKIFNVDLIRDLYVKALNALFSIGDFSMGQTTLHYLRENLFDVIKIGALWSKVFRAPTIATRLFLP